MCDLKGRPKTTIAAVTAAIKPIIYDGVCFDWMTDEGESRARDGEEGVRAGRRCGFLLLDSAGTLDDEADEDFDVAIYGGYY